MAHPEPEFQMRERAVPAEDLNYKRKGEPAHVNDFHEWISLTGNGSDDQKHDPEEMNQDDNISKNSQIHRIILPCCPLLV